MAIWLRFTAGPTRHRASEMMRTMLALYLATALCIGASVVSIKTAALLWFLYGAAQNLGGMGTEPRRIPISATGRARWA